MKTILKTTLVLTFCVAAGAALAAGNLKLNVVPVTGERAEVNISSLTNKPGHLQLTDKEGSLVYYNESFGPQLNFRKVYDFSNLSDGTYKISVVSEGLTTERMLYKNCKSMLVGEEYTAQKPYFVFKNGMLKVTYLNFMNSSVKMNLYRNDEMIYSKKIGTQFSVSKGFDLKKLEPGEYLVCLISGDEEFYYNLKK